MNRSHNRGHFGQRANQTRDLTVRNVQVRAQTVNEENRSVEAVIATENPVQVLDMRGWDIIDEVLRMDGLNIPQQVPMLAAHDRHSLDSVLGSIREIRVEGATTIGRLYFAEGDEEADRAWNKVKQGHITDVSAGYRVMDYVDIKPGTTATVNGREYTAGESTLRVTTKWSIREGSLVPVGADEAAKVRSDAPTEKNKMNKELLKYLVSIGLRADATDADAQAFFDALEGDQKVRAEGIRSGAIKPKPEAKPEPTPEPERQAVPDLQQAANDAIRAERQRVSEIQQRAAVTDVFDIPKELVQRAIVEGWTPDKASAEFWRHVAANTPEPVGHVTVGATGADGLRQALSDAVLMQTMRFKPEAEPAIRAAQEFQGVGWQAIARLCIEAETGQRAPTEPTALLERAVATSTFTYLLDNVATKALHQSYQDQQGTFVQWAGEKEVSDFKVYRDIKVADSFDMVEIGDAGEFEAGEMSESSETYQIKTYGKLFSFTRKMMINDSLGAFTDIPRRFARRVNQKIDDLGYALLVSASGVGPTMNEDSTALFATSRTTPNYRTGTTTATTSVLGQVGYGLARTAFRQIADPNGRPMGMVPRTLLVPNALEFTAQTLINSSQLITARAGTTDANTLQGNQNVHQNSARVITAQQLDGATNGTTAWYLVADAMDAESLVVVYLRGQRAPTLQRKDLPNVLGVSFTIFFDVGVAATDWRGILRSKGA